MTIEELYREIEGDYEQAKRTLRVDKLIDKHIRRMSSNGVVDDLVAAGRAGDAQKLFESAHAAKGVCGNLGLTKLAAAASELAEEFRPGNPRRLSDAEVAARIDALEALHAKTLAGIRRYEAE